MPDNIIGLHKPSIYSGNINSPRYRQLCYRFLKGCSQGPTRIKSIREPGEPVNVFNRVAVHMENAKRVKGSVRSGHKLWQTTESGLRLLEELAPDFEK